MPLSQKQLARRCGLPPHITRLEANAENAQVKTLRRIFDALLSDMLILPLPRERPGDILADRRMKGLRERRLRD